MNSVATAAGSSSDWTGASGQKVLTKGSASPHPHPMGQACLLISPGQARDVGHRDPPPCVGGAGAAMARAASRQKRPRGPRGTGLRAKAEKSPWVDACPFNEPGPRKSNLFLSFPPLPASTWSLGPTGLIVSPRPSTLTLKAAASLSPDQKPTLNAALTPLT